MNDLRIVCYVQDFSQSERMVCLIREISSSGLLLSQQSTKRSKVADTKVTVLGPGNIALKTAHAQKSTNRIEDSIPLSDRLEPVSKPVSWLVLYFPPKLIIFLQKSSGHPSSESLTQLLTQAVASGDGKLLEEVLRIHKEKIVRATVRRLPVTVVLPFLRKVSLCMLSVYTHCVKYITKVYLRSLCPQFLHCVTLWWIQVSFCF